MDHVKAWLRAHPDPRPDAPLFVSARGGHLNRNTAEKIVKRTAARAGIGKRVYPHLFRHSRCTHLLRIGVPEAQVKKLLGWKPNSPMLARYAHLVDRDAYAALLRAHGLEPPEPPKHGALVAAEGELRPVVPMVLGPHTGKTPAQIPPELEQLVRQAQAIDPATLEIFRQLSGAIMKARETGETKLILNIQIHES